MSEANGKGGAFASGGPGGLIFGVHRLAGAFFPSPADRVIKLRQQIEPGVLT